MVLLDARPDGVSLVFRRGTARNVPFQWPLGALAGRTFTATLDGVGLSVAVVADLLTVSVTVAQTLAAAAGPLLFELVETTGVDQPILVGTWFASDRPSAVSPQQTLTVTQNTDTVVVQVIGGTDVPQIASSDPAKVSVVTAGGVTTLGVDKTVPDFARLTADSTPVNNSTVLANITGLSLPVAANAVYRIEGMIVCTAALTADIVFGWTTPAGVSGTWCNRAPAPSATSSDASLTNFTRDTWATTCEVGGFGVAIIGALTPFGILVTGSTAGSLQAQFAQRVAEVSDAIIRADSFILAERLA